MTATPILSRLAGLPARLQDLVLAGRTLRLGPGVELRPGSLIDTHLGVTIPLNATAEATLHLLAPGTLCVEDAGTLLEQRWPGHPVRRDVHALLRRLNAAGLVQPGPPGADTIVVAGALTRPLSALSRAVGHLASGLLFARRGRIEGAAMRLRLALVVALTCLPMTLATGMVLGLAAWLLGGDIPLVAALGAGALLVSTVGHESAHAAWLARGPSGRSLSYLASSGSFRMLVGSHEASQLQPSAASGPLAGMSICVAGGVLSSALGSGLAAAACVLIAATHAFALSPWGSDGRSLRAPTPAT